MKDFKLRSGIIVLLWLDMISKYFFYNLKYLETTSLVRPVLNKGISRSLPVPFIFIVVISLIGISIFIWLFIKHKNSLTITAFLIAGTAGNLIDRLIYGGVRDFINIGVFNFPIFNLADVMLSIWVITRIMTVTLEKKK